MHLCTSLPTALFLKTYSSLLLLRPPFLKGGGSAGVGGLDYLD